MNILILGGKQAFGPGLPPGRGYVAQLVRRVRAQGQTIAVDHHPVSLAEAIALIPRLRLERYDLILLQFDQVPLPLPVMAPARLALRLKLRLGGSRLAVWQPVRQQLATVLTQLRAYRHRVVLLGPLPHRQPLENQLAQLARRVVYAPLCHDCQVFLFDVSQHLTGSEAEFQSNSTNQLSAVAHEVLGSELHTFITEPTYTLWL